MADTIIRYRSPSGLFDWHNFAPFPTTFVADADAQAWADQVVTNGGTVSAARLIIVSALVSGLKTDTVWSKLDRLFLHAAENEPSALTDLVVRDLATAVNTPTFTIDRGYTGDSSTNYINSNFNINTEAINLSQNSCSYGAWVRTVNAVNADMLFGINNGVDP